MKRSYHSSDMVEETIYNALVVIADEQQIGTIEVSEKNLTLELQIPIVDVHNALAELQAIDKIKIIRTIDQATRTIEVAIIGWRLSKKEKEEVDDIPLDEYHLLGEYLYMFTQHDRAYRENPSMYYIGRMKMLMELYNYSDEQLKDMIILSNRYRTIQCKIQLKTELPNAKKLYYERELASLKDNLEQYYVLKRTKTAQI